MITQEAFDDQTLTQLEFADYAIKFPVDSVIVTSTSILTPSYFQQQHQPTNQHSLAD
ncbi:MAG: hypothetical protein RMZ41_022185 [Nostoc sp. DedVER02]|uniref:hypothetical protein n=1 Tax=unclassified Nostoc TaxID=2593658 RepID=UPI002AD533EB|nr:MULTISPECIES: hypothetical protein [unclassified Nostoc]MDZ7987502.1 hypothetical protein [Nostoc sp. DedVER02]MDZ8112625.1 hypothetical protein [Nostoc sp. DedVER01b]